MRIGIAFNLKDASASPAGAPDDLQEEFDSPVTIHAIQAVFEGLGHQVSLLGDGRALLEQVLANPPDFVFNFAEGQGIGRSREARVPAALEMLGIDYSGSDPLALAVTLDKDCARRIAASHGLAVAPGTTISTEAEIEVAARQLAGEFPLLAKPAWEGSSKGIRSKCLIHAPVDFGRVLRELLRDYSQPILVEKFIRGDELTVGIVGNRKPRIVGVMRVLPRTRTEHFVYSLEVKRDYLRQVEYECPAKISPAAFAAVEQAALAAFRAFGCRDVARVDFRLDGDVPVFLEINPLPGLNPESSDLVLLAKLAGWTHEGLVSEILGAALARCNRVG